MNASSAYITARFGQSESNAAGTASALAKSAATTKLAVVGHVQVTPYMKNGGVVGHNERYVVLVTSSCNTGAAMVC